MGELERVKNKLKNANAQASPTRRKVEDLLKKTDTLPPAGAENRRRMIEEMPKPQAIYKTQMALEQQQTLPNKLRDIAMTGKTKGGKLEDCDYGFEKFIVL